MDGIFRGIEKRARAVLDVSFDPLSFEDDDRLGGLRVAMGGDGSSRGEFAQEEASAVGGVVRKVGEFNPGKGAGFPHGGVGEANGWKHRITMPERFRSDNLGGSFRIFE
mgnify:CR=1 FL=1